MAIARLVDADWFEGTPYVEIRGDESTTTLSLFADHGLGIRERVVPLTKLRVGFDEFERAVRLAPQLVAPFSVNAGDDALSLTAPDASLEEPSETIVIDEQSLHEQARTTAPPPHGDRTTAGRPGVADQSGIHTRPTVRRMVAVRPEAFRSKGDDRE